MPILHWLDRERHIKAAEQVPYRLLEADDAQSFGDTNTGNMLIQGDNLEALKALLPYYAGRVKCIFIDPPYNTKSAFEHYDDNLEHSQWLAMVFPRLQLLRDLLGEDGSIWVTIDDNEAHYLKIIMDEVFGRKNFVANVVWQKRTSPDARIDLGAAHDHVIVYSKARERVTFNKLSVGANDIANKNLIEVRLTTSLTKLMIWGCSILAEGGSGHLTAHFPASGYPPCADAKATNWPCERQREAVG